MCSLVHSVVGLSLPFAQFCLVQALQFLVRHRRHSMCLIKLKEDGDEDYRVPARVIRRREASPQRSTGVSILEERRPSPRASYSVAVPPSPPSSPSIHELRHATTYTKSERAASTRGSPVVKAPLSTRGGGRARGSGRETRSYYVEVENESNSSSSESEDVRSKVSKKSKTTAPSTMAKSRAAKSEAGRSEAPRSEYDIREKEYIRDRRYSPAAQSIERRDEQDTYRYIDAPRTDRSKRQSREGSRDYGPRMSYGDDPRGSRTSYRRERERVVVEEADGRRTREYRR